TPPLTCGSGIGKWDSEAKRYLYQMSENGAFSGSLSYQQRQFVRFSSESAQHTPQHQWARGAEAAVRVKTDLVCPPTLSLNGKFNPLPKPDQAVFDGPITFAAVQSFRWVSFVMTWLHKLFGRKGHKKPSQVYLCERPHWRIVGVRVFDSFFRALPDFVPDGSALYIENTSFTPDVEEYLKGLAIEDATEIARGTIWPKPRRYRIPIVQTIMAGLAQISARHAEPEVADHMVVYRASTVLLEWYDAGFDPIYLSREFEEAKVKTFCANLGAKYDELV
ncbi:MAG: hypothetical protein ACREB3_05320, partial [Burkholderiales bacterium]